MGLRLRRSFGDRKHLEPGSYTIEPAPKVAGVHVTLCCPACSALQGIPNHVIDHGGRVTPAFKCAVGTCPFYEWITLDGWGDR